MSPRLKANANGHRAQVALARRIDGNKLTASTGTWKNDPTTFEYQWLLCTAGGCIDAPGTSTLADYGVNQDDLGEQIAVTITAHNAFG